jgi:xanthine dehydrogenase accessory factor
MIAIDVQRRRLCIVGRGEVAERLCELGGMLGYNQVRFADDLPGDLSREDHVIIAHDDSRMAQRLLLEAARATPEPGYLGLAGPRDEGMAAAIELLRAGVDEQRAARVSVPAGIDVGAETPEEIAIAVAAELVAVRRERQAPRGTGGQN